MRESDSLHPSWRYVLAILAVATPLYCQSPLFSVTWDGTQELDHDVYPGAQVDMVAEGVLSARFALAVSSQHTSWGTPVGILELDWTDPEFAILIDGLNPWSPTATLGAFEAGPTEVYTFVPFPAGYPLGSTWFFQGIMTDPTSLFGLVLSTCAGCVCAPQPPVVSNVYPKVVPPGSTVVIQGQRLGPLGGVQPTVTIGDCQLTVVSGNETTIEAQVPIDARSGYVSVSTLGGRSSVMLDGLQHWVSIVGATLAENGATSITLAGHVSIVGAISEGNNVDDYMYALEAGAEVAIECIAIDPTTLEPHAGAVASYGTFLDPEVFIYLPQTPEDVHFMDDDGGPGFNCVIGVSPDVRFIAPITGIYTIRVRSAYSFSTGSYLLGINAFSAAGTPAPRILGLVPNVGNPGIELEVIAWGIDLAQIDLCHVEFPGALAALVVTPYLNDAGRIAVVVPPGARSGHIVIVAADGTRSTFTADDFGTYFLVLGFPTVNSGPATAMPVFIGHTIQGQILTSFQSDSYIVNLQAGWLLSVRVIPFDPVTGRLLRGRLFAMTPLDPEVTITTTSNGSFYASDVHSGPEYSAEIGGVARPAIVIPTTGPYTVFVRPWFYLSTGSYVLDMRAD